MFLALVIFVATIIIAGEIDSQYLSSWFYLKFRKAYKTLEFMAATAVVIALAMFAVTAYTFLGA